MDTPDVLMGAYLMAHFRHYCENCGTFETPQWRKGWYSNALNRTVLLCNACGLKFHKNQYCPYCRFIYGKEQDRTSNLWTPCKGCGRFVHTECERKFGKLDEESLNYHCPNCRKEPFDNSTVDGFSFDTSVKLKNKEMPEAVCVSMLCDMQTD